MKWTFNILTLCLLIACAKEENTNQPTSTATGTSLNNCLSSKQAAFIGSICKRFEGVLEAQYPDSRDLDEAYVLFARDFKRGMAYKKIHQPVDMADLMKITTDPTFQVIWKKENGIWTVDRNGKYFECIYSKAPESAVLTSLFGELSKNESLTPTMVIQALMPTLDSKTLNADEIRTMMAMHLYAELGLNLYANKPKKPNSN